MRLSIVGVLLAGSVSSLLAQNLDVRPQVFCESTELPLASSANRIPLSFDTVGFYSTDTNSTSSFSVVNLGTDDINRLLVVIEYRNEAGKRLVSIEHYFKNVTVMIDDAKTNFSGERNFASLIKREVLWNIGNEDKGPIQKGGQVRLTGLSDLSVTRCPASAVISIIVAQYENGHIDTFFAPDWHLDYEIAPVNRGWLHQAEVSTGSASLRMSKLTVDSNGCASVPSDSESVGWLRNSTPHWLIAPAVVEGTDTSETLALAVVAHSRSGTRRSWKPNATLPDVMAVVHVYDNRRHGVLRFGQSDIQSVSQCGSSDQ